MKRLLLLAAVGAAAVLVPAPAHADDHICVTSGGSDVVCVPTIYTVQPRQICVRYGTWNLVCVF